MKSSNTRQYTKVYRPYFIDRRVAQDIKNGNNNLETGFILDDKNVGRKFNYQSGHQGIDSILNKIVSIKGMALKVDKKIWSLSDSEGCRFEFTPDFTQSHAQLENILKTILQKRSIY